MLKLSAFLLTAALFSQSALATNQASFALLPNENCALELSGATSIPRLYCEFSLGLQASEIALNDIQVNYDLEQIPYSDSEFRYELAPEIKVSNGYYVFAFTFLDDMLDGFTTAEGAQFKRAVIDTLKDERVNLTLEFEGKASLLDKGQLGQVTKP